MRATLHDRTQDLREQSRALHTVSPLATLGRGYAIVTQGERVLTSYEQTEPGATIRTRLAHGVVLSKVEALLPEDPQSTKDPAP